MRRQENVRIGELPMKWGYPLLFQTPQSPLAPLRAQQRYKLLSLADRSHRVGVLLRRDHPAFQDLRAPEICGLLKAILRRKEPALKNLSLLLHMLGRVRGQPPNFRQRFEQAGQSSFHLFRELPLQNSFFAGHASRIATRAPMIESPWRRW